jgi:hypothetical protein
MPIRSSALISTSLDLPDVDGPVWYGMPILQTIATELRHAGYIVDDVEQHEDADGGMNCTMERDVFFIHLIFVDDNLWMVSVQQRRGCLSFRKLDPVKLSRMLTTLHEVLRSTPSIVLHGWIEDVLNEDPAEQQRFETPI